MTIMALAYTVWLPVLLSQGQTQAEKLGFPPGRMVVLLHADDVGMCYEANQAAKEGLTGKHYLSASAMAPTPWFPEIAQWSKEHPEYDLGLHLTLNSEWRFYRWGPCADRKDVPGLVDKLGFLHDSTVTTALRGNGEQVEKELRAQVERALALGMKPSHLDSHMGTCFARPDFIEAYIRVAKHYDLPAFILQPSDRLIARLRAEGQPFTHKHVEVMANYEGPKCDDFYGLSGGKSFDDKKASVLKLLKSLQPGITYLIFHPQVATETTQNITGTWQIREWERQVWADPEVRALLASPEYIITNWRELKSRYDERFPRETKANSSQ